MLIIGIDPGETKSGFVAWDTVAEELLVKEHASNNQIAGWLLSWTPMPDIVACEGVVIYDNSGGAIGNPLVTTCLWIGEYRQVCKHLGVRWMMGLRKTVITHFTGNPRFSSKQLKVPLLDRFGDFTHSKNGLGTAKKPGKLFGINKGGVNHMWDALSLAVWAADIAEQEKREATGIIPGQVKRKRTGT